jgi:hypothetical protein
MPSYWSELPATRRPTHAFEDSQTDADGEPFCAVSGCTWPAGYHPMDDELISWLLDRPAAGLGEGGR